MQPTSPSSSALSFAMRARAWFWAHRADMLTLVVLLAILAAGYTLRATGRNWDDFTHLHPDERFLTDVASRVGTNLVAFGPQDATERRELCNARYPAPEQAALDGLSEAERQQAIQRTGVGGYFDAQCSDLNPNNTGFGLFVYGRFPLFSVRATGEAFRQTEYQQCLADAGNDDLARIACTSARNLSPHVSFTGIQLNGRLVSSLADTIAILVVFLIGLKLFGRGPGLLAAALYAFAAFPIQQSHFWTADAFTSLWFMLALYAAVNVLTHDASRPARFSPGLWFASALALWAWELESLGEVTAIPLLVYGAVFGLSGAVASLNMAQRDYVALGLAWGGGSALLGIALVVGSITGLGFLGGVIVMTALMAFILMGLNDLAAYGGTWPWLMGAFGLWVFDSLAHQLTADFSSLALYALLMSLGGLLASALYKAEGRREVVFWSLAIGIPLGLWALIVGLSSAISGWGVLAALGLIVLMASGTAFGYRDYVMFGLAFGATLAGRVNMAPAVGLLLLAVLIRSLPLFDRHMIINERYRLATVGMAGLLVAGAFTVLSFRVLEPHAFIGLYHDQLGRLGF
ncbi:MAG: hypothetical protein ACLFTK_06655, partial [Anaerolineales bacterium]